MVEHIVDQQLGLDLVGALQFPGVGGLGVEQEVGVDGVAFAAGVVGILLADIFADELQLGVLYRDEGGDGGSDDGGREGEVGVSGDGLQHGVAVGEVGVGEIDGLVAAQGEVGIHAEPVGHFISGLQLDADAVALLHILHEGIATAADVAVGGHLVAVEHGVEVGTGIPAALGNLIAELEIEHGFGADGVAAADGVLDVAATGFAVADAGHEVGALVVADAVVDAGLGVEEEVVGVEVHVEEVVGVAVDLVVDHAQLQVGIGVKIGVEVVVGLGVEGVVQFVAIVAVPLVGGVDVNRRVAEPDDVAVVFAVVVEEVVAEREAELLAAVAGREVGGVGVVEEVLAGDEVVLRAVLEGGEVIVLVLLVFHLLVVAVAVGEVEGGVDAPAVAEQVADVELVVALPVVVGLVGVVHRLAVHLVLARGVVGGVVVELVVVGAVPGDAGGLATDNGEEFDQGALAVPAGAAEEALLVGAP